MKDLKKDIKIIIADDSPEFIEGLQVLLSAVPKYEVIDVCINGKELLECPALFEADLLLIDIEMPVLNGIEAAKRINFNHPAILMIAITMYIDKVYMTDIISAGFKAFIHKPKTSDQLFDVIEKVLNKKYVFPSNLRIY